MLNSASIPTLRPSQPTTSTYFENGVEELPLPQPASSKGCRTHQRSRTAVDLPPLFTQDAPRLSPRSSGFFPFLKHNRDRSLSPERVSPKEAAEFEVDARNSRESSGTSQPAAKNTKLSNWFNGTSDPVNIGLVPSPTREKLDPVSDSTDMWRASSASNSTESLTQRPSSQSQKRPSLLNVSPTANNSTSRFAFFRKPSQPPSKNVIDPSNELANLDISAALYPGGPVDGFSPAALKNLQVNAEGTLIRFQKAYQQSLTALKAVTSEKLVQADELEAAETRNEHLKLQLTDMAERAIKQEGALQAMRQELETERRRRKEDEEARKQSIRVVPTGMFAEYDSPNDSPRPLRRQNRISDISSLNDSESGSSSADSVFSEPLQGSYSPGTSVGGSPILKHVQMYPVVNSRGIQNTSQQLNVQFQDCARCRANPSEAWAVVDIVQLESKALKDRIAELESAQEDALDFLSGLNASSQA